MKNIFHVLNGDALKERFPANIEGQIIVARECLVDGDVKSENLEELFNNRASFIVKNYGDVSPEDYFKETVSEFEKIKEIPEKSDINLWFEDDLFCQVNFWFVVYLLFSFKKECKVFLVRPLSHNQYGFGGLKNNELVQIYHEKKLLSELAPIADLWKFYQSGDNENLLKIAKKLKATYPFILNAVEAHLARIPNKSFPGKPTQTLIQIIDDLKTDEFAPVFKEFCKRESIYGFGDMQVKRLFDEIKNNSK